MTQSGIPASSQSNGTSKRPLSPHLQVWKWTLTMFLSILHRATGIALSVGTLMLVWWLVAAASGPAAYETFTSFASSTLGQLMLFGWTLAMYLHLCTGTRHLLMDTGRLLTIKQSDRAGIIILLVALGLTISTWACLKLWI